MVCSMIAVPSAPAGTRTTGEEGAVSILDMGAHRVSPTLLRLSRYLSAIMSTDKYEDKYVQSHWIFTS